jgi:hypothetical protein
MDSDSGRHTGSVVHVAWRETWRLASIAACQILGFLYQDGRQPAGILSIYRLFELTATRTPA